MPMDLSFLIDQQLNNLVCKHGYQHLVQYADQQSNRLMFTVDNYSKSEEDFECIRSQVSEIVIGGDEFPCPSCHGTSRSCDLIDWGGD